MIRIMDICDVDELTIQIFLVVLNKHRQYVPLYYSGCGYACSCVWLCVCVCVSENVLLACVSHLVQVNVYRRCNDCNDEMPFISRQYQSTASARCNTCHSYLRNVMENTKITLMSKFPKYMPIEM